MTARMEVAGYARRVVSAGASGRDSVDSTAEDMTEK